MQLKLILEMEVAYRILILWWNNKFSGLDLLKLNWHDIFKVIYFLFSIIQWLRMFSQWHIKICIIFKTADFCSNYQGQKLGTLSKTLNDAYNFFLFIYLDAKLHFMIAFLYYVSYFLIFFATILTKILFLFLCNKEKEGGCITILFLYLINKIKAGFL